MIIALYRQFAYANSIGIVCGDTVCVHDKQSRPVGCFEYHGYDTWFEYYGYDMCTMAMIQLC